MSDFTEESTSRALAIRRFMLILDVLHIEDDPTAIKVLKKEAAALRQFIDKGE